MSMLAASRATRGAVPVPALRGDPVPSGLLPDGSPPRRVATDGTIFSEGDPVGEVYEVAAGVVRLCKLLPDGRRAVLGFRLAGEVFGLGPGGEHGCTAEAVTDVRLRSCRGRAVEAAAERSPEVRRRLSAVLWRELGEARASLLVLGRMTARERVASFLLRLSRRADAADRVELAMGRLDIADHLGLTVETVSRTVTELRHTGVIALPSPNRVLVLRPAALRALAGEADGTSEEDDARPRLAA
jgi:CRP-like cAMP-binding protein